jgi:hypothetical protein
MPRRARRIAGLAVALAAALVATGVGTAAVARPDAAVPAARPRWTYRVEVAPDLATLKVRWCLERFVPRRAWLADVLTLEAITFGPSTGGRLVRDPNDPPIVWAEGVAGDACFTYTVDVATLVRQRAARRLGRALLLRMGGVLLRAGVLPDDLDATVEWVAPEGVDVAAPWEPVGPRAHRVDPSTWEFQGWVVLGAFARRTREIAGCRTEILAFDGALVCSEPGVDRWLTRAMEADALLFDGRFPRPRLLVGIEPVRPSNDPVPFGSAWSGGGPHAFLQVAANCRDGDFHDDWTATHELLHAALPHVKIEDAWCGEGFVTYYQEVLRARAGMQSPTAAWQAIHEGFGRGRRSKSTRSIADDSLHMHERHEYWRVYWAGAALALRIDVAARRASGGRLSLDDAMRALVTHPAADRRSLTGREVVEELARRVPGAGVAALADALLRDAAFPDVAATYRDLGLVVTGDHVTLGAGPLAAIRDAIMATPASAAPSVPGPAPAGR